jgi:hypothetical protein
MEAPEGASSYSISLRLRRTIVEYAYVNVPVVGDVVKPDEAGVGRIDMERLVGLGIGMGQSPEVVWYQEERRIETHPLQKAPEPGERRHPF